MAGKNARFKEELHNIAKQHPAVGIKCISVFLNQLYLSLISLLRCNSGDLFSIVVLKEVTMNAPVKYMYYACKL